MLKPQPDHVKGCLYVDNLIIRGGVPLKGELSVHGAKNSSLPLLAATILGSSQSILHNCPCLSDVDASIRILSYLGCKIKREGSTICVDTGGLTHFDVPENLMREMRSSIVFLGAIIGRLGKARLSFPGGCELGPRPIDLHLSSLRQMGLTIKEEHGFLDCSVEDRLKGTRISLAFPSVGATENVMLAATLAEGQTVISNAAQEPEIIDLANFLNACGAKIHDAGKSTITIDGVDKIYGAEHNVIPDRIVAATYMCCAAITKGELLINKVNPYDLESIIPIIEQTGCKIYTGTDSIYLKAPNSLKSIKSVRTMPYPGFPTDAQAPVMALTTVANGTSVFVENIFDNRFKHVNELMRMGADIKVEGKVAVVEGVDKLFGASVEATDLRGGAALIIAGL
ncbi:MAG: murA, partial [Oscillospiraceae bacterium]|nr:murA [Oscillospiraceae bacterium]